MAYTLFEGEPQLESILFPEKERDAFKNLRKELGFTYEKEFFTFCVSVALYSLDKNPKEKIQTLDRKQVFQAWSALKEKAPLYDYLIITHLKTLIKRKDKFEDLFYTGLKIVLDWWEKKGRYITNYEMPNRTQNKLGRMLGLIEYLEQDYGPKKK